MLSKVISSAVFGVDAYMVKVEVDTSRGLPSFTTVGLPDTAVKEAKDRVCSAIRNSGFSFPNRKITVNLAPADIRKEGPSFDLAMAIGILASSSQLPPKALKRYIVMGELSLDGSVRRVRGILPIALACREAGLDMIVPYDNMEEAGIVEGINVYPVKDLHQTVRLLKGEAGIEPYISSKDDKKVGYDHDLDMADVRGQYFAKRALEVAASGGHNILLIGPPGSGKTMLARRLPTILPQMAREESVETTKIHSVIGLVRNTGALIRERPFRSPHHTISDVALIGGGSFPRPGEVSLSHNGVLFLDEFPEFKRNVLDGLRQPMEDGLVTISRVSTSITYPARFMLVAAMNPCPCGYYGSEIKECICTPFQIRRYLSRISGPLLDRIDIHIEVPQLSLGEISSQAEEEPSETIRVRVEAARSLQDERFRRSNNIFFNGHMGSKQIKRYCSIDKTLYGFMERAIDRLKLSARAYDRILKVSRTIADLEGSDGIKQEHIAEAVQYRTLDRDIWR